jgi:hypothetical protein
VDIRTWLECHDLGQYAEAFASNDIDGEVLRTLTADDLKELGVASLGHRKQLLEAIAALQEPASQGAGQVETGPVAISCVQNLLHFGSWLRWWWALVGNAQRCPQGRLVELGGHAQGLLLVLA